MAGYSGLEVGAPESTLIRSSSSNHLSIQRRQQRNDAQPRKSLPRGFLSTSSLTQSGQRRIDASLSHSLTGLLPSCEDMSQLSDLDMFNGDFDNEMPIARRHSLNRSSSMGNLQSFNNPAPRRNFLAYNTDPINRNNNMSRASSMRSLPALLESKGSFKNTVPSNAHTVLNTEENYSRQSTSGITSKGQKQRQQADDLPDNRQPNFNFLEVDGAKQKDKASLVPNTKWWHGVFFFSLIAVLACIITLWAPYPFGARMPTEMVAEMPWSDGCKNLASCICPRETICADDLLAMILLTISRCSAWFDYPLYMCMFLSKCNNLNNYLQKTVLRCWINFSDYHKVHRLFGIVVGVESASHSFFHLLRWARHNDDIQVSKVS